MAKKIRDKALYDKMISIGYPIHWSCILIYQNSLALLTIAPSQWNFI